MRSYEKTEKERRDSVIEMLKRQEIRDVSDTIRSRLKELLTPSTPDYVRAGFETEADFLLWLVPKSPYENRAEDYKKWGFSSRDEVLDAYVKAMKLHN